MGLHVHVPARHAVVLSHGLASACAPASRMYVAHLVFALSLTSAPSLLRLQAGTLQYAILTRPGPGPQLLGESKSLIGADGLPKH